jgi:antitoxin YefM
MRVINYTDLRLNLKKWMDYVTDDYQEVIITRKDNKHVVLISIDLYNSLKENKSQLSEKNMKIISNSAE